MVAVGGDLKAPFSLGTNAVQLHELLHPLLARRDAARHQLASDARPAVGSAGFGVHGLYMHQQCLVAQAPLLDIAGTAHQIRVVAGRGDLQHPALHRDRPQATVRLDESVLQIDPLTKYSVAFPSMSRSIFTRASSARSRLISIWSALTGALLSAGANWNEPLSDIRLYLNDLGIRGREVPFYSRESR